MLRKAELGLRMERRGKKKEMIGVVLNSNMDKTVRVMVERLAKHKKYKKYIRYRTKYLAQDSQNSCQPGDKVRIIETRPLSKLKRWRVLEVLERAE